MSAAVLCGRIFRRQLVLAFRRPIEIANPLLFFLMVVALFPLGLGPEPAQLADFAPGILWIRALLSSGPASSRRTRLFLSSLSRLASTQPALPAPTMM